MGDMTLIETQGLAVGHGRNALLSGLDLRLGSGKILAVLGPNGVGKTTVFRTLLGLLPPMGGRILLCGHEVARLAPSDRAALVAHVPQALATPFAFSAFDIVLMGASVRLGPFDRPGAAEVAAARAAMAELGIADLSLRPVTDLSGGQRQMVLIARAIAQGAKALIMDEPTASLDFANRILVQRAIRHLATRGIGIIFSTHDPDQAAALADRVLLIGRAGVVASGPAKATMTADRLSDLYGLPVLCHALPDGRSHYSDH
ncbi:MAG: ABC transporter ATP-binding protein [Paracoccaceae bacterium]